LQRIVFAAIAFISVAVRFFEFELVSMKTISLLKKLGRE